MANAETVLQSEIMLALGKAGHRLWRNNSGALPDPKTGVWVRYGVGQPGGSDLIGMCKDGVFCAIEVKTPTGRVKPEQQRFVDMVRANGGRAGIARSVQNALDIAGGVV